jgi:hypothetical protein
MVSNSPALFLSWSLKTLIVTELASAASCEDEEGAAATITPH